MKNSDRKMWIGFDIKGETGLCLKPQRLEFWHEDKLKRTPPEAPFHYHSDALVGLSSIHLNSHLKNPFSNPKNNFSFCHEAWQALEPHHEMFLRSQPRVQALRHHLKDTPTMITSAFERNFSDVLESCQHPWGIDLEGLTQLIESIDFLEGKMEKPLLYNFNLKLSRLMNEKFHYLHSMLFNLRSLIALDYNSYIQDPAHEAVKVDSITDYLAKAEYVANDALLYYNFKKLRDRMPEKTAEDMSKSFRQLSHNGFCLVESLPKSFLSSLNHEELSETLYIVQMDWLLGTDAGLLFRVREELFGLLEGYDQIFWPDIVATQQPPHATLEVTCKLTEKDVFPTKEVA